MIEIKVVFWVQKEKAITCGMNCINLKEEVAFEQSLKNEKEWGGGSQFM